MTYVKDRKQPELWDSVMIQYRLKIEINTDPQRRCYNGCHFSSEIVWTAWTDLESTTADRVETRLTFWRELNDYAVKARGEVGTRKEFRVIPLSKSNTDPAPQEQPRL